MSQIPTKISEFDNGMTNDLRIQDPSFASVVSQFDNYTKPGKLTPHRSMKLDAITESTLDTFQITKMVVTPSGLYGFGIIGGGDNHAQVYVKTTPNDPTALWTTAANGTDASNGGAANDALFVLYHNFLYGGNATGIWKYGDITGAKAFTYNDYTAHGATAQGLVHSKDDNLYVPSNNLILVNNNGSWSVGLTLPTNASISSICEDNNYLDIACNMPDGTAVVYQWDRDTSLSTLSEKIDWGTGNLKLIESIGGVLVGISTNATSGTTLNPEVQFKEWTGGRVVTFQRFSCTLATISNDKQKYNDLFYFLAEITMHGSALKGVWKIFKKRDGSMTVSFDRLPRNDTALTAGSLKGFRRWGDYMFVSYLNPADLKFTIWRTDDQANYTATSVFETIIFNSVLGLRNKHIPDSTQLKDFVGADVSTEPLPSGGQVVAKYKIDAGSSWTTFLTHATANSLSTALTQMAAKIPQHKEIYIRLESTRGAEITGFGMLEEVTDKKPY